MPRIARSSIDALKNQINLVDVVAPYVQMKREGRSWRGLSPFNTEKTPSFYVHPDSGFYKCFSSGEGGDLYNFIMKMENLEFQEAVEYIAEKFNQRLEYESGGPSREEMSLRKQLFALHESAADWFHRRFLDSEEAAPVREYWRRERGFSMEVAENFGIGYAPAAPDALSQCCRDWNITDDAMRQSGLFSGGGRNGWRAFFRGRLTIPIRDVQGRVIAFTARQLPQTPADDRTSKAKYVNSPETPIFQKKRILFGMDHARTHLRESDSFLLVEGQLDAIRCWSVGLHTAVAPQGTGVTEEQMQLMRRYAPASVECVLDGDTAGRAAALKLLPLAFKAGLQVNFLPLPDNADPDDLLREEGPDALRQLRERAVGGIELAIRHHLPDDHEPTTADKNNALRAVFELVRHLDSEVAREDHLRHAAGRLRVNPEAVVADYRRFIRQSPRPAASANGGETAETPAKPGHTVLTPATWDLLWIVSRFPEFGRSVSEAIDYEWLSDSSPDGALLMRLLAEHGEDADDETPKPENLVESVEERELLADIRARDLAVEDPANQIKGCLHTLRRNYLHTRRKELEQKIANIDPSSEERLRLMREVREIRSRLASEPSVDIQPKTA